MSTKADTEASQTASSAPQTVIYDPEGTAGPAISAFGTSVDANKSTAVGDWTEEEMKSFVRNVMEGYQAETDLIGIGPEDSAPMRKRSEPKARKAAKRSKRYTGADDETTTIITTDEGYKARRGDGRTTKATGGGKKERSRRSTQPSTLPTVSTKLTGLSSDDIKTIILSDEEYKTARIPNNRSTKGSKPNAQRWVSHASDRARTKPDVDNTRITFTLSAVPADTNTGYTWTDYASFLDDQACSAVSYIASSALDLATYASKVAGTALLGGAATALGAGLVYDLYTGGDGSQCAETVSKLGSLASEVAGSAVTGLSGYMTGTGTSVW